MAILQRVALYPGLRLDIPDARAIQGQELNDWKYFLSGVFANTSYIVQGFEISNYSNIFLVPGFNVRLDTAAVLHMEATTQAAGFYITNNQEPDSVITLSASATNYIEVDFKMVSGTPDIRSFWDSGANGGEGGEYTDTVDTVLNIELVVTANIAGFTAGKMPLYKVITNGSGVVTQLTDCRNMLFRLGSGGNTPNPFNSYSFPSLPDASHSRQEGASTVLTATSSNAPFQGGDKNFKNLKHWMDAVMTIIREIKNTPFWYSPSGGGSSISSAFQNAALTVLLGGTIKQLGVTGIVESVTSSTIKIKSSSPGYNGGPSSIVHNNTTYTYTSYNLATGTFTGVSPNPVGVILTSDAIRQGPFGHLELFSGSTIYMMGKVNNNSISSFVDIDMTALDSRVLFCILPSSDSGAIHGYGDNVTTPVTPKQVTAFTSDSVTVGTGGNYKTTGGKILLRGVEFSYTSYVDGTGLFQDVSPDPSGIAVVGDHVYAAPSSGVGYLHLSSRENVPGLTGSVSEGAERVFWLAIYDGVDTIRTRDGEVLPGEVIQIGNNDTQNIINYIGSTGPADDFPVYDVNSILNGTDLTSAIQTAFQIIETPIYDETVTVPVNNVAQHIPVSPNNNQALNAVTTYQSQGFTSVYTGNLTSITMGIKKVLAPDTYLQMEIQSDSAGAPSGIVLASSDLQHSSILSTSYSNIRFDFITPLAVTNLTVYHIVIKAVSVILLDGTNYIDIAAQTANPYAGGVHNISVDSGATYTPDTNDLYFNAVSETGLLLGAVTSLPLNTKTMMAQTHSPGSDALVVYVDGVLMEPGQDYDDSVSSSITWLKAVVANSRIRLRIGNVGGANNYSGTVSLQAAYSNGYLVTVTVGLPATFSVASGKAMQINGDLGLTGLIV